METRRKIDARDFRNSMGRFATGVTVVTTVHDRVLHGMTANAFVSISIDPVLVLVSVAHRAQMHRLLLRSGRYAISVLAEEQEALARHFSGRPQEGVEVDWLWKDDLPIIPHALAHLVCTVHSQIEAGDHTIFLGAVEDISYRDGYPLVFFGGRFFGVTTRPGKQPEVALPLWEDREQEDTGSFPLEYYW